MYILGQTAEDMKENGKMENSMGEENTYCWMGQFDSGSGKMANALNGFRKINRKDKEARK